MVPGSWSPDGKYLLYAENYRVGALSTNFRLWVLPLQGDKKPFRLLNSSFMESDAQISPDGRWVAYASAETGRSEIYVRPFPTGNSKWPISSDGGSSPHWADDGNELLYLGGPSGGTVVSVNINAAGDIPNPGTPELFAPGHAFLHTGPYALLSVSRMANGC
jgi:Tol biopolymer transport system component